MWWNLVRLALLVGTPVVVAVVIATLGATTVAPAVVVLTGIALVTLAFRLGLRVYRRYQAGGFRDIEDVPAEQFFEEHPHILSAFPVLLVAGVCLASIGVVWLIVTDWMFGLLALVLCFVTIVLRPGMLPR